MSPISSKIDFQGDPIFESVAWFFVIILKFIFTSTFEIKIHEKNSLTLSRRVELVRSPLMIFFLSLSEIVWRKRKNLFQGQLNDFYLNNLSQNFIVWIEILDADWQDFATLK